MNISLVSRLKPSRSFLLATAAIGAVVAFHSPVLAFGFTGIFASDKFTLANSNADGSVNTTNAASGTVVLTGGNNGSVTSGTTTWKTIAAIAQGAKIFFRWSFAGENFVYDESAGDRGGYIINSTPTYLGLQNNDSGFVPSLFVTAGQTFGFIVQTADNIGDAGVLTITEFDFTPDPIPEPLTILGTGVIFGALPILKKEYAKRSKKQDKDA